MRLKNHLHIFTKPLFIFFKLWNTFKWFFFLWSDKFSDPVLWDIRVEQGGKNWNWKIMCCDYPEWWERFPVRFYEWSFRCIGGKTSNKQNSKSLKIAKSEENPKRKCWKVDSLNVHRESPLESSRLRTKFTENPFKKFPLLTRKH